VSRDEVGKCLFDWSAHFEGDVVANSYTQLLEILMVEVEVNVTRPATTQPR
jgi:hypothetical protein